MTNLTYSELYRIGASNSFQVYNVEWALIIGLKPAILLMNLITKDKYFHQKAQKVGKDYDHWFFHIKEEIHKQTAISIKSITTSFKELKVLKIIESRQGGIPAKTWYRIILENVDEKLLSTPDKSEGNAQDGSHLGRGLPHPFGSARGAERDGLYSSNNDSSNKAIRNTNSLRVFEKNPSLCKLNQEVMSFLPDIFKQGKFPHKISAFNPSKTLMKSVNLIAQIKSGAFLRLEWDDVWLNKHKVSFDRVKGLTTFEDVKKRLLVALKRWVKMKYDKECWPQDKSRLPKDFPSFIYNPRNKNSWFLYCLYNQPELTDAARLRKVTAEVPDSVKETVHRFYNNTTRRRWTTLQRRQLVDNINSLTKWWEGNFEVLSQLNDGWYTHCGDLRRFFNTIRVFVDDVGVGDNPYFLPTSGNRWERFIKWMDESFGINIQPDAADIRARRKSQSRRKAKALQKRVEDEMERITRLIEAAGDALPGYEELEAAAKRNLKKEDEGD